MPTITIEGMSCQHCVNAVTKALEAIPGITNVHVSLEKKQAEFASASPVDEEKIHAAIRKIGFISSDLKQ
jgi:copper chaperone